MTFDAPPIIVVFVLIPLASALVSLCIHGLVVARLFARLKQTNTAHTHALARLFAQHIAAPIAPLGIVYETLEPEKIAKHIVRSVRPQLDTMTDEILSQQHSILWENVPSLIKNRLYASAHRHLPRAVDNIIEAIGDHLEQLMNLEHYLVDTLLQQPELLKTIIQDSYQPALKSFLYTCTLFGFVLGYLTALAWWFFPNDWLLVLSFSASSFCSYSLAYHATFATKAIAIGPFNYRSVLLKQQHTMALQLSKTLCQKILTLDGLARGLINGPHPKLMESLIKRHLQVMINAPSLRTFAQLTVGLTGFATIKSTLLNKVLALCADTLHNPRFIASRAEALQTHTDKALAQRPLTQFQPLLNQTLQREHITRIMLTVFISSLAACLV